VLFEICKKLIKIVIQVNTGYKQTTKNLEKRGENTHLIRLNRFDIEVCNSSYIMQYIQYCILFHQAAYSYFLFENNILKYFDIQYFNKCKSNIM
jgi:hypothetical protein